MIDWASVQTYYAGSFPNVLAINSTGAATQDGTEYIAEQINNGIFGPMQAFMDYASLTPNGVTEAAGASQMLTTIEKGFGVGPGKLVGWFLNSDPSVTGDRVLLLQGQGILHANYPELLSVVYVGDGQNAAVAAGGGAFYKATDAAGTIPNIAGNYLILPESRGYTLRGLDLAATVDPLGASRFLGDNQMDAMQRITGNIGAVIPAAGFISGAFTNGGSTAAFTTGTSLAYLGIFNNSTSTSPNAAKTDDVETRMSNLSIKFGITY